MCGLKTDLCDATRNATCRKYRTNAQVWNGFAKNAPEGLGTPGFIWIWTALLALGHLLPFASLGFVHPQSVYASAAIFASIGFSMAPRIHAAWRFEQSWLG